MAPPTRNTEPDGWDKDKPGWLTVQNAVALAEIAAASGAGGPVGGALELAYQIGSREDFYADVENWKNMLDFVDRLLSILERLKNFNAESPTGKLEEMLRLLGKPVQGYVIPQGAVGNSAALVARALHRPADNTVEPHVAEAWFLDEFLKKKKRRAVTFNFIETAVTYPIHVTNAGETTSIKLGFVLWKIGENFVGGKDFISAKKHVSVAPFPTCDGYDYFIWPGNVYVRTEIEVETA
jgi:hypothetical protein